jgi:hypothetical protein
MRRVTRNSNALNSEERAQLLEMGEEIARERVSPWQPRCVAEAFRTREPGEIVLTMQQWINMDAIRSPFLLFETPAEGEEALRAWHILAGDGEPPEPGRLIRMMLRAVAEAFSTALAMRDPAAGMGAMERQEDGFGAWLPLFASLVAAGMSRADVLATPVKQAYALHATFRRELGWLPHGANYRERDALEQGSDQ